jgi:hypothetical protein
LTFCALIIPISYAFFNQKAEFLNGITVAKAARGK